MTRELKLALIIGVTLVLGVAVLISDHLAVGRRPKVIDQVASQPAMTPSTPAAAPEPEPLQVPTANPKETPGESSPVFAKGDSSQPEIIRQLTKASANAEDHSALRNEVVNRGGSIEDGKVKLPLPPAADIRETSTLGTGTGGRAGWATSRVDFSSPVSKRAAADARIAPTYTILPGDSAFKLAKQYLGDGKHWKKLVDANPKAFSPDGQVHVGAKIVIPLIESGKPGNPSPSNTTPGSLKANAIRLGAADPVAPNMANVDIGNAKARKVAGAAKAASYTVKKGDTLSGIARRELGSVNRADEIIEMNKGIIKDPDSLPLGLAIKLPTL